MKNISYKILVTLLICTYSFAQNPAPSPNPSLFEAAGIVLSEEQKTYINSCVAQCTVSSNIYSEQVRKYSDSIRVELLKPNPSKEIIKDLIQKRHAMEAEIEYLQIERDLTILTTLTPGQRTQLSNYQSRMHEHMRMRSRRRGGE